MRQRPLILAGLLLALGACQPSEADVVIAGAAPLSPPSPAVEMIAKGAPHGGEVAELALTEEADAALTFDAIGGMRLWPTLDGTRPPVPVAAEAPRQLALVHAGRDLVAAILDSAGGVRLLRLGLDGAIRARVQLPGEYLQVVALDKGVVVRTTDHAIEWYSNEGVLRGRVVADASQQVHALATRRGHAVALVGDAKRGAADAMRWLVLADTLGWSRPIALPSAVMKPNLFALSPSHNRIAYLDHVDQLMVYDVGDKLEHRAGNAVTSNDAIRIGFVDDNRVVVPGRSVTQVWRATPPQADPWAGDPTSLSVPTQTNFGADDVGIGDGLVVRGFAGGSLALIDDRRIRYLGYKDLGFGVVTPVGSQLAMTITNSRILWLDDKLEVKREVELKGESSDWMYATPIGEHHVVTQTSVNGKYELALVDTNKPTAPIKLGAYNSIDRIEYTAESGLLGVALPGRVERFALDLDSNTATPLPKFKIRGSVMSVRLLDPARAGGVVAITNGWESDFAEFSTLAVYRQQGKKVVRKKLRSTPGTVLMIDATGKMYIHVRGANEGVIVRRGDEQLAKIALPPTATILAVSDDGSRIAYVGTNEVVMVDATGRELWRQPLWSAGQLTITRDAKKVVVRASGGFVVLDAATGVRVAMECGWGFGLHAMMPRTNMMGQAPVCEDPTLQ